MTDHKPLSEADVRRMFAAEDRARDNEAERELARKSKVEQFRNAFREYGDDYHDAWDEYDSAAEWCARRSLRGAAGDPLPEGLSARATKLITDDPETFQERVQRFAYAIAMNSLNLPEE